MGHGMTSWCHFGLGQNWSMTVRGATLQLVTTRIMARPFMQSRREIWRDLLVPFWPRAKVVEGCAWRDSATLY